MSGQSRTTHPSSDGNSTTSHQSEPKHKPPPVRDDCWSESATFTLIESWGAKILKLNAGSLRQHHWQEVADAVNSRHGKKPRRSDVQCKNRIDTLKKKYKVEKGLVSQLGSDNYTSPWPFFTPLDSVIGSAFKPSPAPAKTKTPARINTPENWKTQLLIPPCTVPVGRRSKRRRRNLSNDRNFSGDRNSGVYGELAEAIGRFADVYARVEESKQRQMVELEKQRMRFTKDLEIERMKLLMESQVQLRKLNAGSDESASTR